MCLAQILWWGHIHWFIGLKSKWWSFCLWKCQHVTENQDTQIPLWAPFCSSNFEPSYLKKTQVWLLTALYSLDLESRKWFLRKYFFSFMEKVSREDVITHCLKEECFQKNNASVCPAWMLLLGFKLALCDRFSVYLTSFNIPVFYSFSFRKMNCLKWSKANFEGKKRENCPSRLPSKPDLGSKHSGVLSNRDEKCKGVPSPAFLLFSLG